ALKFQSYGIMTVRDIQEKKEMVLKTFGKQGEWICRLAFGEDDRPVTPYRPEDAKSISREFTFQEDVEDFALLQDALLLLALCVEHRAERVGLYGNGITLKVTYGDMKSITRSKVCPTGRSAMDIYRETSQMLQLVEHRSVRLIGAGLHNLSGEEGRQLSFEDCVQELSHQKEEKLQEELARLQDKYGLDFAGNIEKLYHGDTLHKTLEYMRKKI
nr:DNA polymerase IV [Lachnospiraceae bacterium]